MRRTLEIEQAAMRERVKARRKPSSPVSDTLAEFEQGLTDPTLTRIFRRVVEGTTPPVHPIFGDLGPCWLWTGPKDRSGYGTIMIREDGKQHAKIVHRLVYTLVYGDPNDLQEGLQVCH